MCGRSVPHLLWLQKGLSRVDRVTQSSGVTRGQGRAGVMRAPPQGAGRSQLLVRLAAPARQLQAASRGGRGAPSSGSLCSLAAARPQPSPDSGPSTRVREVPQRPECPARARPCSVKDFLK